MFSWHTPILGARFIQREIVRSEMSNPSISSSPWMRGAPQVGFSATMRKINSLNSFGVGLRPTGPRTREISFQYMRKPARCQRTTVSGVTMMDRLLPSRPQPTDGNPEELVKQIESRPRTTPFQHGQLLSQREVFKDEILAVAEYSKERPEREPQHAEHDRIYSSCQRPPAMLLVSKSDGVVARDRVRFPDVTALTRLNDHILQNDLLVNRLRAKT